MGLCKGKYVPTSFVGFLEQLLFESRRQEIKLSITSPLKSGIPAKVITQDINSYCRLFEREFLKPKSKKKVPEVKDSVSTSFCSSESDGTLINRNILFQEAGERLSGSLKKIHRASSFSKFEKI